MMSENISNSAFHYWSRRPSLLIEFMGCKQSKTPTVKSTEAALLSIAIGSVNPQETQNLCLPLAGESASGSENK